MMREMRESEEAMETEERRARQSAESRRLDHIAAPERPRGPRQMIAGAESPVIGDTAVAAAVGSGKVPE
jgi:hypothetical protein